MSKQIFDKLAKNPMMWGYWMFPHHFRDNPPPFHMELLRSALKHRYLAIAAPRESAKSTVLAFLYTFHAIVFKKKRFIVIIGNTEGKAKEHLDAIKREIKDNELLKKYTPKIKLTKDSESDTVFRHLDGFEVRVLCKGSEQIPKVRGAKFGAYRPDLIICDDLEDDEQVRSKERRSKLKEDYDTALIPAGDRKLCQFIIIGTILHDDSQLAKLVGSDFYPEYHKLFYQALNEETGESLWEDKWTYNDLKRMQAEKPVVFAKEMQNDPVSGQNTRFQKDDFRYWRLNDPYYELMDPDGSITRRGLLHDCRGAMSCDLAWETKKESDNSVLLGALLTPDNDLLVHKYIAEKGMRPDRFSQLIFEMNKTLETLTGGSIPVGFEKAMLEKVTKWILKQEMRKRNKFIITKELKWEKDKITRIETMLQPRYANNIIYHRTNMGELEHELVRFPYGVHDDIIDALQGVCQLLKNPKQKKKPVDHDDAFDWWRNLAIKARKPNKKRYVFGHKKGKGFEVPSSITYK
jgi:phage terminase large subunit-like protein